MNSHLEWNESQNGAHNIKMILTNYSPVKSLSQSLVLVVSSGLQMDTGAVNDKMRDRKAFVDKQSRWEASWSWLILVIVLRDLNERKKKLINLIMIKKKGIKKEATKILVA